MSNTLYNYIFLGERPSIFGDVAETSDDSGKDEYESVRSKREPRKKRKKDLTPGTHTVTYF